MEPKYNDILALPHPVSNVHTPMPREHRAAQFAPFAALVGHEAAIDETARLTERRIELDEGEREVIDRTWQYLKARKDEFLTVAVTYFRADTAKDGGAYLTASGCIEGADDINRVLFLSGECIRFEDVLSIEVYGTNDKNDERIL